jgi:competence protein ComEC
MAIAPNRRGSDGVRGRARAIALPGARMRAGALPGHWRAARGWLLDRLAEEAEAGRPALWLPVAFGIGCAGYFAAAYEPELWAAALAFAISVGFVVAARKRFVALGLALGLAAASAGFLAGKLATIRAEAPQLARPMSAEVVGRVALIEPRENARRRVTLEVERFGALEDEALPRRVQFTLGPEPAFTAGDRVSLEAFWRPPEGPVRPGGYDFARVAFFNGIGATAFAPKNVRAWGPAEEQGWGAALQRLRERLTKRITTSVGGPEGTVAAALVTGVQGPIPQATEDALRAAGLSHILSISGLHMALIAGTLFGLVRAALALAPGLALRWPVKGIAAGLALSGATFYLALSGAEVATQRSYVMIAVAFFAVLVGRPALSLRNFALAGLAVMALTPDALLGPSFQMSFAAVAGLLAWFEARKGRERPPPPETRAGKALRWLTTAAAIAVMTTIVAGLATAPFAAYHFHRTTPYALVGNALATPLLGIIVMPSVVGGLAFAPLGLDGPWWQAMGFGLRGVLAIAETVAAWPGSERFVFAYGEAALILFAFGIAWLCLWRTALRFFGVPVLASALCLAAFPARPDLVIDASGRQIAARGPDGRLAILGGRASGFAAKVWRGADGETPGASPSGNGRCDAQGCVAALLGSGEVALVTDARAFAEECRLATLVVTPLVAPEACGETAVVIDRRTLAVTGALELKRDGAAFSGKSARDPAGRRPWTRPTPSDPPPDEALLLSFAARPKAVGPFRTEVVDPTEPDDTEGGGEEP